MSSPGGSGSVPPDLRLPWLWLIEYVASLEPVNLHLLNGIIESAPLSHDELGENVREFIALACLKELCGPVKGNETSLVSPSDTERVSVFNLSQSCEDVLKELVQQGSLSDLVRNYGEPLKLQICRFIMEKRASMPKPVLRQLEDAIIDGLNPDAACFKVLRGLMPAADSNSREDTNEKICLREPVGRRVMDSGMEPNGNSNSAKQDRLGQKFDTDSSSRVRSPSRRNSPVLDTENFTHNSHIDPQADDDVIICSPAAKKLKLSRPDALQSGRLDATMVTGSESKIGDKEKVKFDVARNLIAEDCVMEEIPEKLHEQSVGNDRIPEGIEAGNINLDNEGQQHMEELPSDSAGCLNEDNLVSMSKKEFLASRCTLAGESLEDFDSAIQNACVMCNKGGQLLSCHTSTCPLLVHESCMGSSTSVDENGNFFCPFCQYSTSISNYLKAKSEASDVRKDAATFFRIILEPHPTISSIISENQAESNQRSSGLPIEEEEQVPCEDAIAEESADAQKRDFDLNADLPINDEEEVSNENADREVELDTSARRDPYIEDKQKCGKYRKCKARNRLDLEDLFGVDHDERSVAENNDENMDGRVKVMGDQQEVLPDNNNESLHNHGCAHRDDREDSLEDDIEDSDRDDEAMNHAINLRRRSIRRVSTSPKKTSRHCWTEEEAKILEEGVAKFRDAEDKTISWKKVLEFGSGVFMHHRTTRDLKNKWTNICKRNAKTG